ncbi:MAG: anhydro-N-acetylmuramic acid kinase [Marinobacter sp.]|uniref:anhydro-N-acetylmuramic acid kinase n=1 Tax=Marinobacter sp. TaxID=50741 RepID=UPI00299E51FA|nr:anhydro-N-acetylmuramic acid kinase [Marinobacter sp.]MDX1636055.1 anhydro-N-acetylmuramic acid kinase [Marinobacter sp.]
MAADAWLGLMSGTSMDGIDAVLVRFEQDSLNLIATSSLAYPHDVRERLERLSQNHGSPDELGELDHRLGGLFAEAARRLIASSGLEAGQIAAIGSHGQTVRHQPDGQHPFSLQLGDPNLIAEHTGITTVADFRRRDLAAGGEGAPLVPAFHRAFFASQQEHRCILNIGGIANITWLPADAPDKVSGYDTGPGNALMDAWCQHHTGRPYDEDGQWAAQGRVDSRLLTDMLGDGYFAQPAPKSTGKEKFNLAWINTHLARHGELAPADVQRTLLEVTVRSIADELANTEASTIYVCGGGARNPVLLEAITRACGDRKVLSTQVLGLDPQWVEATAFAWLASQTMAGKPGNLPKVTGARGKRILGAIYQP